MLFIGKDSYGDIFFCLSEEDLKKKYSKTPVLELYNSYFKPNNDSPYCAIITDDTKLVIEDFKLCKDTLKKIYLD